MFREEVLMELKKKLEAWEEAIEKIPEIKKEFKTASGIPLKQIYTSLDIKDIDILQDIGFPGEYPYTRGIYPLMYRTRMFTIREYSGWGTAEETNQRFKYILRQGGTALMLAYDLPSQLGYDPDHPKARGEVGRVGVSASTLDDYRILFDGIPLDNISVMLQANANAPFALAMYVVEAERRGISVNNLWGACQNEVIKEYLSRGAYIYPLEASVKISCDVIEWCIRNIRRWQPIIMCPYHLQEAGANFVTSLGFSVAIAITYVEELLRRGLDIDSFAYAISVWNCVSGPDFFEAICGFRALRRLWARILRDKFKAKNPESCKVRIFIGSGGKNLVATEPLNNIARTTISALAAALGGVQAMGIQCYDESYCIPTEEAIRTAIRVAQIVGYESGVTKVVDPLAGSYFVEWLTSQIEKEVLKIVEEVSEVGGAIEATKKGYFQRIIEKQAYEEEKAIESGEKILVGYNYPTIIKEKAPLSIFKIRPETEKVVLERLYRFKASRDLREVKSMLEELRKAAEKGENIMPYVIRAAKAKATLGEMADVLREVYGTGEDIITL